jgi:transposase
MVRAVRAGRALREVAKEFRCSVSTVSLWVNRTIDQRLDRGAFWSRKSGRAWNRTAACLEQHIVALRGSLREESVLGEYGARAIQAALKAEQAKVKPSLATINRVLSRRGLQDAVRRIRRPAPPQGWYLPEVAAGRAELDCFDFIEDLKIADGPLVDLLTAKSLRGTLSDAWVLKQRSAKRTAPCPHMKRVRPLPYSRCL